MNEWRMRGKEEVGKEEGRKNERREREAGRDGDKNARIEG